jgi:hypothetical protein
MIVVQWTDGFGRMFERSFDVVNEAYREAESILKDLRRRYPNEAEVKVVVLQVLTVMTETGENVTKGL